MPPMRDVVNHVGPVASLVPQVVTGAVNGTGVDLLDFDGAAIVLNIGAAAGTTPTAALKVQESDDDVTYTDVDAGDLDGGLLAALAAADANTLVKRGYMGQKRYVRVIVTAIGGSATPSFALSATVVRGYPHRRPADVG